MGGAEEEFTLPFSEAPSDDTFQMHFIQSSVFTIDYY